MGGLKFSFILYCLSEVLRKIVSYDLHFIYICKIQNYNGQHIDSNNLLTHYYLSRGIAPRHEFQIINHTLILFTHRASPSQFIW